MGGIDIRFDFSLVREANLRNGEGIGPERLRAGLTRAGRAVGTLRERAAKGEIGFPALPFRIEEARELADHAARLRRRFSHLLVLGIGGSALGTKAVLEAVGEDALRGAKVAVADNVDPDTFLPMLRALPMRSTAVVAISKSGGTAETNVQLAIAIEALRKAAGRRWKEHLVLVTDPEKGVFRAFADREGILSFPVPPNVGGRFSVLTPVGLLPLAAAGVDIGRLLSGARMLEEEFAATKWEGNAVLHAAAVYAHYLIENPKPVQVWFTYGRGLDRVAEWWQQLWGESLGKRRKEARPFGQTPARAAGVTDQHSQLQLYQDGPADKVYTFVTWGEAREGTLVPAVTFAPAMEMLGRRPLLDLFRAEFEGTIGALWKAGRPVVRIEIGRRDEEHVGAFLHFWEWVTAIVGLCGGVDPFDQPGVEEGKILTRALMGEKGSAARRREFRKQSREREKALVRLRAQPRGLRGPARGRKG